MQMKVTETFDDSDWEEIETHNKITMKIYKKIFF